MALDTNPQNQTTDPTLKPQPSWLKLLNPTPEQFDTLNAKPRQTPPPNPSTPDLNSTTSPVAKPNLRLPNDPSLSQDAEWCEVEINGQWKPIRFHDYHEIYNIPHLYEALFYDHLGCTSPSVVCSLLRDALAARGEDPTSLRVLDFGAGNGMVAEEIAKLGTKLFIGADILPEARLAALRDRPHIYTDYFVADFTALSHADISSLHTYRLNALVVVAALGFGDIPVQAFATAFNAIQDGGWVAFNIRDLFLRPDDDSGFASFIRLLTDRGYLEIEMTRRYVHRHNVAGQPLEYVAFIGRKLHPLPNPLPSNLQRLPSAHAPATPDTSPAHTTSSPRAPSTPRVRLENVSVLYHNQATPAVNEVSLELFDGELLALVGESGSGKSTLLRTINRLITPTTGTVWIDDDRVDHIHIHKHRRRVGYVIQNVGLLPHLTVGSNVAVVPQLLGWKPNVISQRVDELLTLVGLEPELYRLRMPSELSGGQQQRVGFARALAARPGILLMDEPFGAVDPITRRSLQQELALLHRQLALTSLLVTHDIAEAFLLADRIAVMRHGRLLQVGTPAQLLHEPASDYVASLVSIPLNQAKHFDALAAASEIPRQL